MFEKYLRQYVGDIYRIAETEDIIYIGTHLPDEYSGSNYTKHIKGTIAKAQKSQCCAGYPRDDRNRNIKDL